jgi:proteasome alpha subunit
VAQKIMYSPFDFNQTIVHRAEYVEERLKGGLPVVGVSYDGGVLLFSVRRTPRKVFEIYDQIMFAALGNQADVEAVRLAAIDFCHQEGFARSADDVSVQRLVGFAISPPLKRAFGDPMTTPNVMRAIFAEMGKTPERDAFFVLNYDGEFSSMQRFAVAAGSDGAADAMRESLEQSLGETAPDFALALRAAAASWRAGVMQPRGDEETSETPDDELEIALKEGRVEAAILDRHTPRESKFRLLREEEIQPQINTDGHR